LLAQIATHVDPMPRPVMLHTADRMGGHVNEAVPGVPATSGEM